MRVASVEALPVAVPFTHGGGSARIFGGREWDRLSSVFVRIGTEDGLVGWGEAFGKNVTTATAAVIEDVVAPLLTGLIVEDSADGIAATMDALSRTVHLFGRRGVTLYALSGVDIALWDLLGKQANRPVSELIGGRAPVRTELPAYASLFRCADTGLIREVVGSAVAEGFATIKLHEADLDVIAAAREAAGDDTGLIVDTNCAWTTAEAIAATPRLAELGIAWLEEPVWPPEDFAGLALVRAAGGPRIAAGENCGTRWEFAALLAAGAVDIAQPSPAKVGGLTECVAVAGLAARHRVRWVPHCPYFGPGFLAALHLLAGQTAEFAEFEHVRMAGLPYGCLVSPHEGRITIPAGVGLGADPDPAFLRDYRQ
jgi:L-alanine-DL-glutamate epimerase-like enolase superfamily enzyme